MSDVSRRDAVKLAAGLAVGAGVFGTGQVVGQESKKAPAVLDAVLRVEVTDKGFIKLVFETPGATDQAFDSSEYRYALLDGDGKQITSPRLEVSGALMPTGDAYNRVLLPKARRSVTDYADIQIDHRRLKAGGEYYLVVSVRNLTAFAKFKSP